ncbi:glycosyl transferase [Candidatus Pacearchaeota archaeon]|nr:glycosyl transferase [Candidatus Pacearchaeota archaeon]|tara:strand:+ start:1477 stop:2070 length:594 start_codon:yes stop_codon:yes gene_type:complete
MIKKIFDKALAPFLLFLFLPIILAISILIKLDSPGKIIYKAKRGGFHGKYFQMYKFRSMIPNAESTGILSTSSDDSRITKIGLVLRKYKLDELPEIFNVFKGEMSFVGPRPETSRYTEMLKLHDPEILSVLPGITDFSSIKFHNEAEILRGHKNPDKAYETFIRPEKIRLQYKYLKEKSLFTDISLVLKTIKLSSRL